MVWFERDRTFLRRIGQSTYLPIVVARRPQRETRNNTITTFSNITVIS